jgi:hypothetical protein
VLQASEQSPQAVHLSLTHIGSVVTVTFHTPFARSAAVT